MHEYKTTLQAAVQLGVADRTVRNMCEEFKWFGGKLGTSTTWVLTQSEIDKMKLQPRRSPGRPRKPIIGELVATV